MKKQENVTLGAHFKRKKEGKNEKKKEKRKRKKEKERNQEKKILKEIEVNKK